MTSGDTMRAIGEGMRTNPPGKSRIYKIVGSVKRKNT